MSDTGKLIVNNTFWIYFGKILVQLISVFATILVIRKIDVDVYGLFNTLLIIGVVIHLLTTSPIVQVLFRYIPELHKSNGYLKISSLINKSLIGAGILILLFLALGIPFKEDFFSFFNITGYDRFEKILIFNIIFWGYSNIIQAISTSLLLHKKVAYLNILSSLIQIGRASCRERVCHRV